MLNKNEVYSTSITSYGSEGEGVCRIEDIAVFVPFAVRDDVLDVKILKTAKTYAFGKIEQITAPSLHRAHPPCAVYGKCGGCNLMHMNYEEQLSYKRQKVEDCIRHIGKLPATVLPVIGAKRLEHYRNKVQIPVGADERGQPVAGFYSSKSHRIITGTDCTIQHSCAQPISDAVLAWMREFVIPPYDEKSHTGIVRHILIRVAEKTGEIMAGVVVNAARLPQEAALSHALKKIGVSTAIVNINTKKTNVILGQKNVVLFGSGRITDELFGLKFSLSIHSFYQVNRDQTEILYQTAIQAATITAQDTVFDLYCGIGTISLYAAQFAKKVIGIEIVPQAVADAQTNAQLNHVGNAAFYCGDAGETTRKLYDQGESADVVIVDPPRKGCDKELLNLLIQMEPSRIVYISCNPATLARDMHELSEHGYHAQSVQPVDMFIHSSHIESVCLLQR